MCGALTLLGGLLAVAVAATFFVRGTSRIGEVTSKTFPVLDCTTAVYHVRLCVSTALRSRNLVPFFSRWSSVSVMLGE